MVCRIIHAIATNRRHSAFAHLGIVLLIASLLAPGLAALGSDSWFEVEAQSAQERRESGNAAQSQKELSLLEVGKPIERELAGGQTHLYQILLAAGQYLHAVVDQRGIDVVVVVFGPDGKQIVEVDSPNGDQGPEPIFLVADLAGSYRLEVRSLENGAKPGRYEMKVGEVRAATPQDRVRLLAQRAFSQGEALRAQGARESFRKAIEKYEESLLHWRLANDRAGEANALHIIGFVYESLGEKQKAMEYYNQCLPLRHALRDRDGEGMTLNNIGAIYDSLGQKQKALDLYSQALSLYQRTGNRKEEAKTLGNIIALYEGLGEEDKALSYCHQALSLYQAAGNRDEEADILLKLGSIYNKLGDKQKALDYYGQALLLYQTIKDHLSQSTILVSLAKIYYDLGAKEKAVEFFNRSLSLQQTSADRSVVDTLVEHAIKALALVGISQVYQDLGENQKALDHYNQALPLLRNLGNSDEQFFTLLSIGKILQNLGERQRALDHYNQALQLSRAGGVRTVLGRKAEILALVAIGNIYYDLNAKNLAVDNLNQALSLSRSEGSQFDEAFVLNSLGLVYRNLGEYQKAIDCYTQALSLWRIIKDPASQAVSLYQLSWIARQNAHLQEARTYAEESLRFYETIRGQVRNQALRVAYSALLRDIYDFYIDLLMQLHQQSPYQKHDAEALQTSERARARSLVELLAEARADIRQGVDAELIARERSLQQRISDKGAILLQLLGKKEKENQARALEKEIDSLTTEFQQVQAKIRSASPRYAALTQPQPPGLSEIQAQLDKDTLLLEYSLGPENSYLWAVTPMDVFSYQLPKRSEVEALAKSVSQLLTARRTLPGELPQQRLQRVQAADAAYPEEARRLSEMVLGPVAEQLGTKRLLIVADGALQYIPFAALPKPIPQGQATANAAETRQKLASEPTPLVVTNEIVTLPSVSTLAEIRRDLKDRRPAPKSVAVLADPVFSKNDLRVKLPGSDQALRNRDTKNAGETQSPSTSGSAASAGGAQLSPVPRDALTRAIRSIRAADGNDVIPRLPFSRRESEAILSLVAPGDGLQALDFKANRATATSETLSQYRIVHFATHGLLNTERPELSGIILSLVDEKGQPQDGFLQMHEIFNLKLPAELVVLSACQTGLGKENRSEGLMGLTRGFMYAGAARVMASLWQVDDVATAELMKRFYQGILKEGRRPAEALRMAQIEMWKQRRWQAPYYWASFVSQGEWK